MDKKIPDGVVLTAAYALSKEWNLHYPDAVRMAALVLSVGQQWQPAETSNARSEWPARYMANGPQGTFYTDDLKLADALLRAYDEDDDWTVTEMPDPAGTPAVQQPPSAPVGMKTLDDFMVEQEALHPGIHDKVQAVTDELRASLAQQPAAARVDVRKLVALAEQMERDAAGCRRDGYIDAAVVKEDCAYRIRQTLGISASESSFILPGRDPLVQKLRSIVIKDKEKERLTARAEQPETHGGVAAPGSREWMAEVCRAAALSLAAHGVWNDQLLKVADWIAQQGGES